MKLIKKNHNHLLVAVAAVAVSLVASTIMYSTIMYVLEKYRNF